MASAAPTAYGGDEVAAIVVDPGSSYTRIGFAGEDSPRAIIPSFYAIRENPDYDPEVLPDADSPEKNEKFQYFFGESEINVPRPGTEIKTPFENGLITDWNAFQKLCEYAFSKVMLISADLTENPLLFTEQIWASNEDKEQIMDIAFNQWNVPAFYIVKTPVCSTFASGKGSALVVDIGMELTTVTPVLDGLALFKTSRRSKIAGKHLDLLVKQALEKKGVKINPWYLVSSKEPVEIGEKADFVERSFDFPVSQSYHEYQVTRVLKEFKDELCEAASSPLTKEFEPVVKSFEFPDGAQYEFGIERYETTEGLFRPTEYNLEGEKKESETNGKENGGETEKNTENDEENGSYSHELTSLGISELIIDSIKACDVDIRPNLANNVVIVGGTSLTRGMTDRINHELTEALAGLKIRFYASGNTVERKFSSWIGGSILASLGTFHQLWVSKKEYEEMGASKLLEKRFR